MKKVFLSMVVAGSLVASSLPNFETTPSVGNMNSNDSNLKSRVHSGIGFGSKIRDDLMLNLLYFKAHNRAYKDGVNKTDTDTFILNPEYYLLKEEGSKFLPYITAGLGFQTFDNEMYKNEDGFLFNYGVGLRYILNPLTHFKAEAKQLIDEDGDSNFFYTAGLSFPFGVTPEKKPEVVADSDGDGVNDNLDKCPNTPKGVEVDSDGCPLDSDGDGVPDYLDKCPNTPKGTKVDKNGCPIVVENDSDGDGVTDKLDKCPNTPKGVEVDSNGCPLDSDGDGVPDYLDKCPNTPKGFRVDKNGCEVSFVFNVTFDYDSANLKDSSFASISDFTKFLNENPQYKVEVQGHTDSKGSDSYNQKLSEKRAKSVYDKLIQNGIAKNRLSSKGYGEVAPVANNATEDGRGQNRRVEGKLIK